MRHFLASLALTLCLSVAAQAQEDPVSRVINDQIDAFLADDFDTAFSYASPNIKRLFGSPERFGQMVRRGYPMVHRPAEVTMLDQRRNGPRIDQRVMIRDQTGRLHLLAYDMVETPEGWQINGVAVLPAPDIGT